MSTEALLSALWRRKLIVILTVVITTGATFFVAQSFSKVYVATASLFVGQPEDADDFDAVRSGQALAKTYAELIQSRNVASRVAAGLPGRVSSGELLGAMKFEPVTDTQLISVTAEANDPDSAALVANAYARGFTDYVTRSLQRQTGGVVEIADPARPPSSPDRPRPVLYAATAAVLALFLGAGLALLRDRLDTRLRTEGEVAELLDASVLARVPATPKGNTAAEAQFYEAFRVLWTSLTFLGHGRPLSTLLVTSADAREGKSTAVKALARVLAEQGRRVLIVEGDMRWPGLAESYQLDGDARGGLSHYLVLGAPLDEVVQETSLPNIRLLPAGTVPPNPSALLRVGVLEGLVRDAREWADVVLFDSPSVHAGADAAILAQVAEGILFVANHRQTVSGRARAAVTQLRQADVEVAGVIFNEAPLSPENYFYGRAYGGDGSVGRQQAPAPR